MDLRLACVIACFLFGSAFSPLVASFNFATPPCFGKRDPRSKQPVKRRNLYAGKSVLLTGASGGLGSVLASQLVEAGVSKLVLTGRNQTALERVAQDCKAIAKTGSEVQIHVAVYDFLKDDGSSIEELGQTALRFCNGTIDILINNAGVSSRTTDNSNVTTRGNFLDVDTKVIEKVMHVNFFAGVVLTKQLIPAMIDQGKGGTIVWISGVMGKIGIPSRTSNVASKFAIQGFSESLRPEVADHGIRVHVASPGYIRSARQLKGEDPARVAANILDSVAKGRNDFLVYPGASARLAMLLKFFFPSLLEKLLVKRSRKPETPE